MYTNINGSWGLTAVTMRATLKQYEISCRNAAVTWLSDEIDRTETDYNEEVSAELSSYNYTNSTHSTTFSAIVESLDDISNISGTGPSYVEKWLYNQPKSSTPRRNKSRSHIHSDCTARRNLFTTNTNNKLRTDEPQNNESPPCIALPTSERPPCIGAEISDESTIYNQHKLVLGNTNSITHCNESVQSDDTMFLEKPFYILPVTSTKKKHTILKKLKRVRNALLFSIS